MFEKLLYKMCMNGGRFVLIKKKLFYYNIKIIIYYIYAVVEDAQFLYEKNINNLNKI